MDILEEKVPSIGKNFLWICYYFPSGKNYNFSYFLIL